MKRSILSEKNAQEKEMAHSQENEERNKMNSFERKGRGRPGR